MSSALTIEASGMDFRHERPEGLMSFLVSRSKSSTRSLTPSSSEVLRGCWDAIEQILRSAIESRTKADYERIFESSFPKYVSLTSAISHFATAVIPKPVREQLVRETICELEVDFRDKGLVNFGATVRDQAMFTVWTLRKVSELTTQIMEAPLDKSRRTDDEEFCCNFNINALRAQFSLDCLETSLRTDRAIYPEVLEEIVDGLRSMVNAYTWARRGLELRVPSEELILEISPVDDEDRALLDFSLSVASEWLADERGLDAPR